MGRFNQAPRRSWLSAVGPCVGACLLALVVVGTSGDVATTRPTTQRAAEDIKIIPWIELNRGTDEEWMTTIGGLLIWQKITDTAVVSTIPGNERFYRRLRYAVPDMTIIPGIKTNDAVGKGRFDWKRGWKAIADSIERACETADVRICVLENETAMYPIRVGEFTPDLERFRTCIQQLPKDVELWWYPGIPGWKKDVQLRYKAICEIVDDELNVRLTDITNATPTRRRPHEGRRRSRAQMAEFVDEVPIPMIYVGRLGWEYDRLPEAIELILKPGVNEVLVYPGYAQWLTGAQNVVRRVSELRADKD